MPLCTPRLPPHARSRLGQHGLFSIFEYTLADSDRQVRLSAAAMLASVLEHDPSLVRSLCLAQIKEKRPSIMATIIDNFLVEQDPGLRSQYLDLLRILLEPPSSALGLETETPVRAPLRVPPLLHC